MSYINSNFYPNYQYGNNQFLPNNQQPIYSLPQQNTPLMAMKLFIPQIKFSKN